MSIPQKPNTPRRCLFIRTNDGAVYVPRPNGWMGGLARNIWLAKYFGKGVAGIASPSYWSQLGSASPLMVLSEIDGEYSESVYEGSHSGLSDHSPSQ